MNGDIDSINHVGLAVRDMDAAARRYEDFGFILTPLSVHSGASKPGEPVSLMATGNRCAVFPNNYLEILAIVNPGRPDWFLGDMLRRFQGAHVICFGCGSAEVVHRRVTKAAIATSGVIPLQRDVDTPEGMKTAKFECVHFDRAQTPEGLVQAAHHRTPEYIHQARYIGHANRVVALTEVVLMVADANEFAQKYERLIGCSPKRQGAGFVFTLPLVSRLTIVSRDDVAEHLPASLLPAAPCVAGFGCATTDLPGTAKRLEAKRIPFLWHRDRLVVPAEEACGAALCFEAA